MGITLKVCLQLHDERGLLKQVEKQRDEILHTIFALVSKSGNDTCWFGISLQLWGGRVEIKSTLPYHTDCLYERLRGWKFLSKWKHPAQIFPLLFDTSRALQFNWMKLFKSRFHRYALLLLPSVRERKERGKRCIVVIRCHSHHHERNQVHNSC